MGRICGRFAGDRQTFRTRPPLRVALGRGCRRVASGARPRRAEGPLGSELASHPTATGLGVHDNTVKNRVRTVRERRADRARSGGAARRAAGRCARRQDGVDRLRTHRGRAAQPALALRRVVEDELAVERLDAPAAGCPSAPRGERAAGGTRPLRRRRDLVRRAPEPDHVGHEHPHATGTGARAGTQLVVHVELRQLAVEQRGARGGIRPDYR